jgi:hypothetical protein
MNLIFRLALTSCLSLPLVCQDPTPPKPSPTPVQDPAPAPTEKKPAEQPKVLQLGERLNGDITLSDIDGRSQRAHDLMGSITVVNFYSIQCPIQADWDGRLAQIQKDFAEQGVNFLHINSNATEIGETPPKVEGDARPYDNVRQHLAKKELPFRVLVDHGNKVADMFDAKTTPHIYVFGKDGRLVYKGLVDDDQHDKRQDSRNNFLRDVLGKLVKGDKVEPTANKEIGCTIKRVSAGAPRGQRSQRGQGGRDGD